LHPPSVETLKSCRTYLPAGTCDGVGCCRIDISLNISRISDSARSKKVLAFITGAKDQIFGPIDALGAMLPTLEIQYTVLEWAIPYQPDCQRAIEDRTSYACVSNWSRCQDSPIGGYVCYCLWGGDEGNPYIHDGCPTKYQSVPLPPLLPPPQPPGQVFFS
jgi:hypothetical protein